MLIEIHMIQNHSPANLNRDDLGAPKTCYFGGSLRSRISSQCLKRSIRMSDAFKLLCGGVRTRRLPQLINNRLPDSDVLEIATEVLQLCGVYHEDDKGSKDVIVFLSNDAVDQMAKTLAAETDNITEKRKKELAKQFAGLIASERYVPDMALSGRMLEPAKAAKDTWKDIDASIEASLQVAHAISTHKAIPEVDYFVAADDVPGSDVGETHAGGAHIGEAMFSSACFYKYFSIDWEQLVRNLNGNEQLAAHTVGAFIRGAATANPSGKQNSMASHNPPDGVLVEFKDSPVSYANAFADPTTADNRDLVSQSIAQLASYVNDLDEGYGKPAQRFWFSPNGRYSLEATTRDGQDAPKRDIKLFGDNVNSLDELVNSTVKHLGFNWDDVQKVVVNTGAAS